MPAEAKAASSLRPSIFEGWEGILLIAATYVYFLIFAQFGFLKRLAQLGITENALLPVMGAMAIGGISMSVFAPRSKLWNCADCRLQTGLVGCMLAAVWSLFPLNAFTATGLALMIGLSLGLLTVTLVANLPVWMGYHRPLIKIALGTGIGYFLCNIPPLFTATPQTIALTSSGGCLLALVVAKRSRMSYVQTSVREAVQNRREPFALILAWFTALVWLDSAAFYIIQNSPLLKAGTWQGDLHLWRAGALHLVAALIIAWLLARRGVFVTLALALTTLGAACLLLSDPALASMAAVLYPIGVSMYSVVLVAYPSFLMPAASQSARAHSAGYLYAVAGWMGSAMGIGMGRNLHHVPAIFIAAAAALFMLPWLWDALRSGRLDRSVPIQVLSVVTVLGTAFAMRSVVHEPMVSDANSSALTPVERGRRVYIAEGCINCHSQYVRPNTTDVSMWGPVRNLDAIRREQPPMIGNRRQGPDLSQVGARRSPLWMRMHFMNPRDVSFNSIMPRYDYLFRDGRGDDLIAYLSSLNSKGHWGSAVIDWHPTLAADAGDSIDGSRLFAEHCATCHTADGSARRKWSSSFRHLPPDLVHDALPHIQNDESGAQIRTDIARIIKFGLEGTDMPGHEYMTEKQVAVIADYIANQRETTRK